MTGAQQIRIGRNSGLLTAALCVEPEKSPKSLYSQAHVTFEEDAVYDQRDAEGFIKLNALRLRLAARRGS